MNLAVWATRPRSKRCFVSSRWVTNFPSWPWSRCSNCRCNSSHNMSCNSISQWIKTTGPSKTTGLITIMRTWSDKNKKSIRFTNLKWPNSCLAQAVEKYLTLSTSSLNCVRTLSWTPTRTFWVWTTLSSSPNPIVFSLISNNSWYNSRSNPHQITTISPTWLSKSVYYSRTWHNKETISIMRKGASKIKIALLKMKTYLGKMTPAHSSL